MIVLAVVAVVFLAVAVFCFTVVAADVVQVRIAGRRADRRGRMEFDTPRARRAIGRRSR